jgi:mRNA interferase YafQ
MEMLIDGVSLPPKYRDHPLQGQWKHLRDCHIEGDWILLYELSTDEQGSEWVMFHATDNHENLFG